MPAKGANSLVATFHSGTYLHCEGHIVQLLELVLTGKFGRRSFLQPLSVFTERLLKHLREMICEL